MKREQKRLKRILVEISDVASLIYQKGWAEKNAGNLSWDITDEISEDLPLSKMVERIPKTGFDHLKDRYFLITKSGSKFRDIAKDPEGGLIFIKINSYGDGYFQSKKGEKDRPTSEIISHLIIQNYLRKIQSTTRVILHTHPTEIITLTHIKRFQSTLNLNRYLVAAHPEVSFNLPNKIGFVGYHHSGSRELADATLLQVKDGKTVIVWERHGAIAIESDLISAFDNLEIVNKASLILLQLYTSGKGKIPSSLSKRSKEAIFAKR